MLRTFLGITNTGRRDQDPLPIESPDAAMTAWRGPSEVKAVHNLDRGEVESVLQRARSRWLKQPGVTEARNDLAAILERAGGVLSGDELALALLSKRGSTALGVERKCRGRAVVRAALEAEASRESNRFTWRRLSGGTAIVVAATVGTSDENEDALDGEELADYAANLGVAADQLATADPLVTPATAIERLRLIAPPRGLDPLSDHRLTRLAAACSATAAVSSRLELYPPGSRPRTCPPNRSGNVARQWHPDRAGNPRTCPYPISCRRPPSSASGARHLAQRRGGPHLVHRSNCRQRHSTGAGFPCPRSTRRRGTHRHWQFGHALSHGNRHRCPRRSQGCSRVDGRTAPPSCRQRRLSRDHSHAKPTGTGCPGTRRTRRHSGRRRPHSHRSSPRRSRSEGHRLGQGHRGH